MKVVCVILLLCALKPKSAFEYEQLDIEYDTSSSTIHVSPTTSTTSTSTSSSTTTTIPTTTTDSSLSFSPASPTPVGSEGDRGKTRGGYRVNPPIEVGRFGTTQTRENYPELYRHPNERRKNPKCVSEDDFMKKIHEIFLASTQPPDDSSQWSEDTTTTTIRVERDHPNPYGHVRNFKNLIFSSFLLYLIFIIKKQNMCS